MLVIGARSAYLAVALDFLTHSLCADSTKASALTERYPFPSLVWHIMVT